MPDDDDDDFDDDHDDDHETMIEDFLDCTGRRRSFRLQPYANGRFLDAVEVIAGEPVGMRFAMKMDVTAWGRMRDKIRRRLAERDVAVDSDTGNLQILCGLVRAHIVGDDDDGPVLVVDDRRVTWHELGRMLSSLEGWDLRIEVVDPVEG